MAKENTIAKLVSAYNELLEARKIAIGTVMEETDGDRGTIEQIKRQFSALKLDSFIKRSRMHDSFIKVFRKDFYNDILEMLTDINEMRRKYSNQTHRRSKYGLITPIAFCHVSEISWFLRNPQLKRELKCDLALSWHVKFQQLSEESTGRGILDVIGVTHEGLMHWWTGIPNSEQKETLVWKDMAGLARKLVYLFDKTDEAESKWKLTSLVQLNDSDSQTRIVENIVPSLKNLAQELLQLLFIRQDNYLDILPLFEMLLPAAYALALILKFNPTVWLEMGSKSTALLNTYMDDLMLRHKAVVMQLSAEEELKTYENINSQEGSTSRQSFYGSTDKLQQSTMLTLQHDVIQAFERFGMNKMNVIVNFDQELGSGSFANVYKCQEVHGRREVAVKFLSIKQTGDADRVKNRLLREARFWSKLKNENINSLLGFCINPNSQFPGLVSTYCKFSLEQYVRSPEGIKASNLDKLCLLYDIANGLDYMHRHEEKLIHGDVRPSNILLVPHRLGCGYNAVLSDFGISYTDEDLPEYELTSLQRTNIYYLAPELLLQEAGSGRKMISQPGDIYAFGCVFLRVMYGKIPFYFESHHNLVMRRSKKISIFPATKKDIKGIHWDFLESVWSPKAWSRPSAAEVTIKMDKFKVSKE